MGDRITLFRRWQIDGTWARVAKKLQVKVDDAGHLVWEVSVDSAICRAHQHAAGARKCRAADPGRATPGLAAEPDDHALGRSRGGLTTKVHMAVDASFHVLAAVVTAGHRADAPVFTEVMDRISVPRIGGGPPRPRPAHVLADRAYSSRQIRQYLRRRQIPHTIPEKRDQVGHRLRRGSTGGRPPGFDRE
ncbi:IS5 family transposase [Streptomyces subrutilus]|uniref:IS5 family transposase n=1 Tax=Streptomyces subrutilus TaxID=36818 RepID=UPI000B24123E|nr:IS5 family transposase [Streptomyces subrutilus]